MPLSLIIFHKFIAEDEKWISYDNLTKKKSWIDHRHQSRNPIVTQKKFDVAR